MNELSPRKLPRSPIAPPKTPPRWKRPEEVMKMRKLRMKQQALGNRMNVSDSFVQPQARSNSSSITTVTSVKRKNPFKINDTASETKKIKDENSSHDRSLFSLLGLPDYEEPSTDRLNINDLLKKISEDSFKKEVEDVDKGSSKIAVDWAVRAKVRFISPKQFPWTQTLKTCEEASGLTGFVRCVNSSSGGLEGLDTSPNAVFHMCCLYWQHPSLPWLQLFPRTSAKVAEASKFPSMATQPKIKESLHRDWTESFRSLFQLVRTRHCPYFYMFANTFTGIFRAAGINGRNETNVMISPTTVGFRKLLKEEGIEFTMPLKKKDSNRRSSDNIVSVSDEVDQEAEDEDETQGETSEWLASLGVEKDDIKRISSSQEIMDITAKKKVDGDYESLIFIEGCESQALFNFLINCRSITPTTGLLAGVPPTLIAPVAFSGATLSTLKVRESIVKLDSDSYHSLEVKGPILPHTIFNLTNILKDYLEKFSVTFATVEDTKAFSKAAISDVLDAAKVNSEDQKTSESKTYKPGQAFSQESLSDCGLQPHALERFCSEDVDNYDSIKFSEEMYTWS